MSTNNAQQKSTRVVTRFAPSPTGLFHVGGIRSALYNYLFARKHGGTYILRCEDTDTARSKKEYEEYFLDVFRWLGLEYDAYYRQSDRTPLYEGYLKKLIAEDKAYVSKEEPKKVGERSEVIRFRNPNKAVSFHDEVLGDILFDTKELGDFVIARDFQNPLYHLTVVVDDYEMHVTHIIRGQEHVSNTPRQILIQEAIGAERPIYAHGSVILNEARAKLSKRDPLVRPALEYRDDGYLPEAMLNFMALLGWNPGTEQEIFTLSELVRSFSLERMQKPGAVFNPEKLEWINREHVKRLSHKEQAERIASFLPSEIKNLPQFGEEKLLKIVPLLVERIGHFGEIATLSASGEISYYFQEPVYEKERLFWKDERDAPKLLDRLGRVKTLLLAVHSDDFTRENVKNTLWNYANEEGRGQVLWPLRYALSGKEKSPDPFHLAEILGKEETLKRIDHAITLSRKQ
ncbi:MAG: glutamate--tRNA ligase family protein [bacterium]|nr:glutamate--tRNA ligase family protein [bacterium]